MSTTIKSIRRVILNEKAPFCAWDISIRADRVLSRPTIRKYLIMLKQAGYIREQEGNRPGMDKFYVRTERAIPENISLQSLEEEIKRLSLKLDNSNPELGASSTGVLLSKNTEKAIDGFNSKVRQIEDMISGIGIYKSKDISIGNMMARKTYIRELQKLVKEVGDRLNTIYENYTLDLEETINNVTNGPNRA